MKLKIILTVFISLFFFSCKENTGNFINKLIQENQKHKSVSYNIIEKTYYSNELDTTNTPFEVFLVRKSADSIEHGYIWTENKYRPYSFIYNLNKFYLVMPTKNKTRLYPTINESFISDADWIDYFLEPNKLNDVLTDSNRKVTIVDTIWQQKKCKKLTINSPKYTKTAKKSIIFIFEKNEYFPKYGEIIQKNKGYTFHDKLYFSNINFDRVKIKTLDEKLDSLIIKNPTVPYDPDSPEIILENMLQKGDKAPLVRGKYYINGENFDLKDFIGKDIIVLDFWYTHCHPCVKAIPALSAFYSKHKNQDLKIFGMNYIDNNDKNRKNLTLFLSKRKISYPIILNNSSVDNRYKIIGYPSMYVIDKKGNIAYAEVGYEKERFEKLKEKVIELLKK